MHNWGIFFLLLSAFFVVGCESLWRSKTGNMHAGVQTAVSLYGEQILDSSDFFHRLNASEPHVVINRKIPGNIIGGSILDNVYVSRDTGKTWKQSRLQSPYGVYGDPVLISGKEGNVYYFHLSAGKAKGGYFLDRIVVQKSTDGGQTWTDGAGIGYNPPKQQDKPWPAYDEKTGRLAVCWTEFDRYGSKNPDDKSRIYISFSRDGENWTKPVKINDTDGDCLDNDNTVEGAVPAFDRDGNVYVVWAYNGKLWLDYSTDGGITWHKDRIIGRQKAGWTFDIPGSYRANGLPNFFIDQETGYFYVIFGDYDEKTGGDVHYMLSKDKGKSWTEAQKLPVPGDNDQFFPAVAHDRNRIFVVYYDRHGYQSDSTRVRLAILDREMRLLQHMPVSNKAFKPSPKPFFGDYIGVDAYEGILVPFWTEINSGKRLELHTKVIVYEKNQ